MKKKINYVAKAIQLCGGSQRRFSVHMGVGQQTIGKWLKKGVIPARRAPLAEQLTGIPRKRFNRIFA